MKEDDLDYDPIKEIIEEKAENKEEEFMAWIRKKRLEQEKKPQDKQKNLHGTMPVTQSDKRLGDQAEAAAMILELVKRGVKIADACKIAGVSYNKLTSWITPINPQTGRRSLQYSSGFAKALEQSHAIFKALQIKNIASAGKRTWQASAWLLERHYPEEYKGSSGISEGSGSGGVKVLVNVGQGFVPPNFRDAPRAEESLAGGQPQIQSPDLAPQSEKDNYSPDGTFKAKPAPSRGVLAPVPDLPRSKG